MPASARNHLRVAITGASGFLGTHLSERLRGRGDRVDPLVRRVAHPASREIEWDPAKGVIDARALEGVDAVVHLAGEPIGQHWTPGRKRRIHDSRVKGTRLVVETVRELKSPPSVLVSASAVGYYGDRGEDVLTESSKPGEGFLAEVCVGWEEATKPAEKAGIRVVRFRNGLVLHPRGGILQRMLPPFKLGLGGVVGSGDQWVSWIALEDWVSAVVFALEDEALAGAVNAVAPTPVTNREFVKTLGSVLRRPTPFALPSLGVKVIFGEMGKELLLASQRVLPTKLRSSEFQYTRPLLARALQA